MAMLMFPISWIGAQFVMAWIWGTEGDLLWSRGFLTLVIWGVAFGFWNIWDDAPSGSYDWRNGPDMTGGGEYR